MYAETWCKALDYGWWAEGVCDSLSPILILIRYPVSLPPSVLSGFPAPLLNNTTGYSPDAGHYYPPPTSQLFSAAAVDPRSRLGSTTSSTGMAPSQRTTALPNPGYSTREVYGGSRPTFMRADHIARSPSFTTPLRRHPLSPTPSPSIGFTSPVRMEGVQYGKSQAASVPPLMALTVHGQLVYGDAAAAGSGPIKIDIQGLIDKGFFLSDGEWTCYRRNYFSCVCSFSLTPHYPNATMQYQPTGLATSYQVLGFAMTISAVVSDSDSQTIDLVQHTPKRDKGPTAKPEKVRLLPKPQQTSHSLGMYQDHHTMASSSRSIYEGGYSQSGQVAFSTEHTFERIQFKQATANNGKRRAAQQYYHLVVELYADVGAQNPGDQFIKVAERKSAKMIVRGRSPGHYQNERRGSTSSGPGGSSGMNSYPGSQVIGGDYGMSSSTLLPNTYSGSYDTRSGHYGTTRHHSDLSMEPIIPAEEAKAIDNTKDYQYYPAPIYENMEPQSRIEMFTHRNEPETLLTSATSAVDSAISKVKNEYELPSIFYQPNAYYPRNCSRFEGRTTSAGYYPMPLSQSG
ncbi:p53-like transcription factor [Xylariaceae sp. FL1651]|nr:p53-like transcription factor [Xylariaceae sp. FL1651]